MPFIALILGKTVHIKLLQVPPDPGGTDGNIMISQQIHLDFPRAKVIGLPQIADFRHNLLSRCSWAVVKAFRSVKKSLLPVLLIPSIPSVESHPTDSIIAAGLGDILSDLLDMMNDRLPLADS